MADFLNPIAEIDNPDSGKVVLPLQAYKLKDERKFYCPDYDCRDSERILIVKKSNKDNYFFSHRPECGHDIRPETLLHKLAIKWFVDKKEYELPSCKLEGRTLNKQLVAIDTSKTICEFRRLERIIPDVRLTTIKGFHFAIEIVVTNDISESKQKLIKEFNLPTIRIDLTGFYKENKAKCQVDFDFIQENLSVLLSDNNIKSWVIPPDYDSSKDTLEFVDTSSNNGCLPVLMGIGIFILICRLLK